MSTQEDRKRRLGAQSGVVKPRQIAHIVRRTARFDELVRWDCTVLGARRNRVNVEDRDPRRGESIGRDDPEDRRCIWS